MNPYFSVPLAVVNDLVKSNHSLGESGYGEKFETLCGCKPKNKGKDLENVELKCYVIRPDSHICIGGRSNFDMCYDQLKCLFAARTNRYGQIRDAWGFEIDEHPKLIVELKNTIEESYKIKKTVENQNFIQLWHEGENDPRLYLRMESLEKYGELLAENKHENKKLTAQEFFDLRVRSVKTALLKPTVEQLPGKCYSDYFSVRFLAELWKAGKLIVTTDQRGYITPWETASYRISDYFGATDVIGGGVIHLSKRLDKNGNVVYHIVDGQQRLFGLLREFIYGTEKLLKCVVNFRGENYLLSGKTYATIEAEATSPIGKENGYFDLYEKFMNSKFSVMMYEGLTDTLERKLFKKINSSIQLKPQELRHAGAGAVRDTVCTLTRPKKDWDLQKENFKQLPFFKRDKNNNARYFSASDKNYKIDEVCAKLLFIEMFYGQKFNRTSDALDNLYSDYSEDNNSQVLFEACSRLEINTNILLKLVEMYKANKDAHLFKWTDKKQIGEKPEKPFSYGPIRDFVYIIIKKIHDLYPDMRIEICGDFLSYIFKKLDETIDGKIFDRFAISMGKNGEKTYGEIENVWFGMSKMNTVFKMSESQLREIGINLVPISKIPVLNKEQKDMALIQLKNIKKEIGNEAFFELFEEVET